MSVKKAVEDGSVRIRLLTLCCNMAIPANNGEFQLLHSELLMDWERVHGR